MVAHGYNANTCDGEAEESVVQGLPCYTANLGLAWATWDSVLERKKKKDNLIS